jgi:photosystem II stability/assembly factor-like uncharacterized protein
VGDPRYAFASTDGGATWTTSYPEKTLDPLLFRDVAFGDAKHGWAVGEDAIVATTNGGRTWATQRRPHEFLRAVACSGAQHVWVLGDHGYLKLPFVLASSDGGATWTERRVAAHGYLGDVVFADSRHGWIIGGDDAPNASTFILATTDGGAHWHVQYRAAGSIELAGLAASDPQHAWVAGWSVTSANQAAESANQGLILVTSDGGTHWKTQLSRNAGTLLSVAFPDARHGWATGQGGIILATKNGGKTWVAQHSGLSRDLPNRDLRSVTFSDPTHGWAVVDKWGLLATENGGRTWTVVLPGKPGRMVWAVAALDGAPPK